jgi:peptide-methionine (R)-S-oxide reductase
MEKIEKTEEEWRKELSPEQFRVLRQHGTEPAFSGDDKDAKGPGMFVCAGCGLELFDAAHKFDSGTGWPSFDRPVGEGHVEEARDTSHGMVRTEVHCSRCGGHMGHVFPDGPHPTGLRYCINSISLKKIENEGNDS